jgi:hypothetical protein
MPKGRFDGPVPRNFMIELHAPNHAGSVVTPDKALDAIYLDGERFFRIIDIAVTEVSLPTTVVFARVSGHAPAEFSKTWDPDDLGPFKQIISGAIRYGSENIATQ